MSAFVKFLTESRKVFSDVSTEPASAILGSFEATEILIVQKWQEATTVTIKVTVPYSWVTLNIFPSEDPTSSDPTQSRARYVVIRDENGEEAVYFIQDYSVSDKMASKCELEIVAADPRIFAETMTSAPNSSGEDWVGKRTTLLKRLFSRLTSTPAEGMQAFQRIPVSPLNEASPSSAEAALGFMKPASVEFDESYSISSPDPLPIDGSLQELYGYFPDHEVSPVSRWGQDGTQSPWWKWMLRGRVSRRALFSEMDGSLVINGASGSNKQTETMAYSGTDYVQARYAAGVNQGRPGLSGPWAGFAAESVSLNENANVDRALTSKARSATLRNKRVGFDFTLNFTKKGFKPIIGMSTFARMGDSVYRVYVDEIASSYTSERGWLTTAPVFMEQDTVRIASIKDGPFIEFQINMTPGTFSIPTCYQIASPYDWTVELDGVFYGEYQGVGSTGSNGIPVEITSAGVHTIRIYHSTGEYTAGWARAFGFGSATTGAGSSTNRNRLTRVVSDPDVGHILSDTEMGDYFRARQYSGCRNLTESYREQMPPTVTKAGSYAYYYQYSDARSLQVASAESAGSSIEDWSLAHYYRAYQYQGTMGLLTAALEDFPETDSPIGDRFRVNQYEQSGITVALEEAMSDSVPSVGIYFRAGQFYRCQSLVVAGKEKMPSSATTGGGFRQSQYEGCTALEVAGDEASHSGQGGSDFRQSQYAGCTALTEAPDERASGSYLNSFRQSQYSGCTSLTKAAVESRVTLLQASGGFNTTGFRQSQYQNCSSLVTPAEEVDPTIQGGVGSFREAQYSGCVSLTAAAEEKWDHPNMAATAYASNFRRYQYRGCVSLTAASAEVFNTTTMRNFSGFRQGQYMNCTALVTAPAESTTVSPSANVAMNFRESQYEGCTSLTSVGAAALIHATTMATGSGASTTGGDNYRARQFFGCTALVQPQEEFEVTFGNARQGSTGVLTSQYENCASLVRSPNEKYKIGGLSTTGTAYGSMRNRQYYGCSSLVTAGTEVASEGWRTTMRQSQYEGCTALKNVPVEATLIGPIPSAKGGYRTNQYRGCTSLEGYTANILDTVARDSGGTYTAAFRGNQFQNTPATNVAGNRVRFKDGAEAIPGTNVPNDIY